MSNYHYEKYLRPLKCPNCQAEVIAHLAATSCNDCRSVAVSLAAKAHYQVHRAVRKGILPSPKGQPCVGCGKAASAYDHRDYRQPLIVQPVCDTCNFKLGPAKI